MAGKWCLEGWDTFRGTPYPLAGEFENEEDALDAARLYVTKLEMTQPREFLVGEDPDGLQDEVNIVRPDGTRYRLTEFVPQ